MNKLTLEKLLDLVKAVRNLEDILSQTLSL